MKKGTILQITKIYKEPISTAEVIGEFQKNEHIRFTREYRRNGMNWYEVRFGGEGGQKGFIEKKKIFPWKKIKVTTEEAFYVLTNEGNLNEKKPIHKEDRFDIVAPYPYKTPFYRILDSEKREGILSGQCQIDEVQDAWIKIVFYIIFIGIILLSFVMMLNAGFIVVSGLIILLLAGIALVASIVTFVLIEIIKAIVHQIWIRM